MEWFELDWWLVGAKKTLAGGEIIRLAFLKDVLEKGATRVGLEMRTGAFAIA